MPTDDSKNTVPEDAISEDQHKPIPASIRDSTSPVWDMSQERAFIETLLNQRFNSRLVIIRIG
jgi:WD40 repeat protein